MSAGDCVFCRIAAGQLPCARVFEDDATLAFLDIAPLAHGHLLIIPKKHYATIDEMPGDEVAAMARLVPRLGATLRTVTSCAGFNVLQNNGRAAGQVVPHVHFHLIPRVADDGLGYRWPAGSYGAGQAERLRDAFVKILAQS